MFIFLPSFPILLANTYVPSSTIAAAASPETSTTPDLPDSGCVGAPGSSGSVGSCPSPSPTGPGPASEYKEKFSDQLSSHNFQFHLKTQVNM